MLSMKDIVKLMPQLDVGRVLWSFIFLLNWLSLTGSEYLICTKLCYHINLCISTCFVFSCACSLDKEPPSTLMWALFYLAQVSIDLLNIFYIFFCFICKLLPKSPKELHYCSTMTDAINKILL